MSSDEEDTSLHNSRSSCEPWDPLPGEYREYGPNEVVHFRALKDAGSFWILQLTGVITKVPPLTDHWIFALRTRVWKNGTVQVVPYLDVLGSDEHSDAKVASLDKEPG